MLHEEVPDPAPGEGEVLVAVRAVGVNRVDLDICAGATPHQGSLPLILGREFAGVVADAPQASRFTPGDRVWVRNRVACGTCQWCLAGKDNLCPRSIWYGLNTAGGYAELVAVPEKAAFPLPDGIHFTDAASTQVSFGAAWHALVNRGKLEAGRSVLILGGSSGVGTAAVQVAAFRGAETIVATVRSPDKVDALQRLGARAVIVDGDESLRDALSRATQLEGVDIVLDLLGGDTFAEGLKCLKPDGVLLVVGTAAGRLSQTDLGSVIANESRIMGSKNSTMSEAETVMNLLVEGRFSPVVHAVMALSDAAEAHRLLRNGGVLGKIVLEPNVH